MLNDNISSRFGINVYSGFEIYMILKYFLTFSFSWVIHFISFHIYDRWSIEHWQTDQYTIYNVIRKKDKINHKLSSWRLENVMLCQPYMSKVSMVIHCFRKPTISNWKYFLLSYVGNSFLVCVKSVSLKQQNTKPTQV